MIAALPFHDADEAARSAARVSEHLRSGGLIAYPTETVYGLGSRATAADIAALAALKGRAPDKPFLLLVSGLAMAERAGLSFTPAARVLAQEFWPGPLTLVLPGAEGKLPDTLRGPEGGIAVRWTSHPAVSRFIELFGEPITSTSANRPGQPTAPGIGVIRDAFRDAVDQGSLLLLDGGALGNVPPSTLIDCTASEPRLVRSGAIPRDELRRRAGSSAP